MELIRNTFPYCDLTVHGVSVFDETTDAIVPDSFPDVARVVCAEGMVSVKDESVQKDRILVSGTVKAVIIYEPENGEGLKRLEAPVSFAHIEEHSGIKPEDTCFVQCRLLGMEAHLINSRKINISAKLGLEISVYAKKELSVAEGVEGNEASAETLYDVHTLTLAETADVRDFMLLDDIELPAGDELELITMKAALQPTECRAASGKMVVRGEMLLEGLALDGMGAFQPIRHTTGFSQVVEIPPEVGENGDPQVHMTVHSMDCVLNGDGVLSIGVGVSALLTCEKTHSLQVLEDLYQTDYDLDVQSRQVQLCSHHTGEEFRAEGTDSITVGEEIGQIISAEASCAEIRADADGVPHMQTLVRLLYLDQNGNPRQLQRMVCVDLNTVKWMDGVLSDVELKITPMQTSDGSVSIRLQAAGKWVERAPESWTDIVKVEQGEHKQRQESVTLMLRYIAEPEKLWDIAKQYSATMKAIRAANHLDENAQEVSEQMLLIPIKAD